MRFSFLYDLGGELLTSVEIKEVDEVFEVLGVWRAGKSEKFRTLAEPFGAETSMAEALLGVALRGINFSSFGIGDSVETHFPS